MTKRIRVNRMWINQPSTLHPFHEFHGQNVIAEISSDDTTMVYPTSGYIISMQVPITVLTSGWIKQK